MGREKKSLPQAVAGGPKERHRRNPKSNYDPKAPMPVGFEAKPMLPKTKSKHHSYLEFVENTNKKKKLEFQVTTKAMPPPGFEFVPIGNPALTTACKELSREKDAMIFINTREVDPNHLSHHVHRTGHHIRQAIVEEAKANLEHSPETAIASGAPEPLPKSQDEYTAQVNSAIVDLFPRIPNTDRHSIIVHAFNLSLINQRPKPVGLCTDMPLSRRVQLAVLAHIRHTHTRYDTLLKETSWQNARKVVEALCLDILVKWRGDEETGRDQLDEILREVVVISDSDSESEDESDGTEDSSIEEMAVDRPSERSDVPIPASYQVPQGHIHTHHRSHVDAAPVPQGSGQELHHIPPRRTIARKEQRGFKRYRAWEEAIRRNREEDDHPMDGSVSHGSQQYYGAPAHGPGPRIIAGGAGSVPQPNGFVAQQPRPGSSLQEPPHPSIHLSPSPLPHPSYSRVASSTREQEPGSGSLSRHVSPVTNRLQDMLVRSVEPASPDTTMQPSFIRTLPPRTHLSPVRRNVQYHPEPASPSRELGTRDRPFYAERRVMMDRPRQNSQPREYNDSYGDPSAPRAYEPRRQGLRSPLSATRTHAHRVPSPGTLPQRIAVGRPGDRSNPIYMEDRGGFFERVPEPAAVAYSGAPDLQVSQPRWQGQDMPRVAETHRIVTWEEGSRILRDDRNVEIFSIPTSRPLPPEAHSHVRQMDPVPGQFRPEPWVQREPLDPNGPTFVGTRDVANMPLGNPWAPPPQHREQFQRPPGAPGIHHRPVYHDEPPPDAPGRREPGDPPRRRDNVIFLE